jgi:outer membrane protein TolC
VREHGTALLLCLFLFLPSFPALPQEVELSLEQACALASVNAEAIRAKELSLSKSRLSISEAQSRAWPHLDVQASASYLFNPPGGYTVSAGELGSISPAIPAYALGTNQNPIPLGTFSIPPKDFSIGSQEHNYFSFALNFIQPLFTWGKISNAIELASLQADAAGAELLIQRRDINREVHRAYFGALLAERSEKVLRNIRDIAAEVLADRRKALEEGSITAAAVLETSASLAALESKLIQAGENARTARESLGMLAGLDAAKTSLSTDFRSLPDEIDEEILRQKAQKESAELAAARVRLLQARKKLAIEQGSASFRPDLVLSMSLDVTGQEDLPFSAWTGINDTWNWDLIVSLGVKMNAFDGMASTLRIGQAEKDVEMAGIGLSQQEKLVRLGVRRAVEGAVTAIAAVREKRAASAFAEEGLRNAKAAFATGAASRDELHGAELLGGSAELELLLARFALEEALADLERQTGSRL